jgi:hypothetical protein
MTQPENVADAMAQAQQLEQDAERFIASAPIPGEEPTMPMSAADLLSDNDE